MISNVFKNITFFVLVSLFAAFWSVDVYAQSAETVIDNVTIEGLKRIPESRVAPYLIKQGSIFSMPSLDDSIKKLYQTGLFLNVNTDLYVEGDKFILKYIFTEMPLIGSVVYNGNVEIKTKNIREKVTIKNGQTLSFQLIENALSSIRMLYEDENRYGTKVSFRIVPHNLNSVDIYFDIVESEKAKIYNIRVYGNEHISTDDILNEIPTKERGFWSYVTNSGKISKDMMLADRDIIRMMYLERGYAKVAVGDVDLDFNTGDPEKVNMMIRIEEGPQFSVRSVEIDGYDNITLSEIESRVKLKVGDVFNIKKYQADIADITSLYTSRGYAYANVEPIISLDDETKQVDIVYKIEESVLVRIGKIIISGNDSTNDNVIRRQIDQMEGALYNSDLIQEAKANTMATGFFENVQITESAVNKDTIDLNVNVTEQSTGTFTLGAAYSSIDGIMGMIQLSRNNFFGLGHSVSIRAEVSQKRTDFSFSYTDPWFMDWPISVGIDVFNLEREWYEYTRNSLGGSIRVGHALVKRRLFASYRFSLYTVDIYDIENDASQYIKDQKGFTETRSFSPSLTWNNLNNAYDPTEGNKSQIYIDFAGMFLGGSAHFLKVGGESTQYIPLLFDGDIVLMLHVEGGYIAPLKSGSPIPVDERFRIGGINSIRGFDYGEISPLDSEGKEYGGNKYYQGNIEVTFPLKKDIKLKGVVFFDIGQVFAEGHDIFSASPRKTAGAGLRWLTPMGPFRFEWGYKLDRKTGEAPYKFEFSIGGTF